VRNAAIIVLAFGFIVACSKKGPVGATCQDSDDCKNDICAFGVAPAGPVCTKQCKGNGEPGQCPSGWQCSGTASILGASASDSAMSICVPEASAPPKTPTERAIGEGLGNPRSADENLDSLRSGPAGKYLPKGDASP